MARQKKSMRVDSWEKAFRRQVRDLRAFAAPHARVQYPRGCERSAAAVLRFLASAERAEKAGRRTAALNDLGLASSAILEFQQCLGIKVSMSL